jgi:hypothetical protein
MKREEVRAFLKAGADAIPTDFDSGRVTEFNSKRNNAYPFSWVESLRTTTAFQISGSTLIDSWNVVIHIAMLDKADSNQEDYEPIIDACDQIARKLIWQYNRILYISTNTSTANQTAYKLITLDGVSREPFIKKHADVLTGVILSFTLIVPDRTDVCP